MTQQSATATTKSRRRYFATPLLFVLPFQLALLPAINAFQTSTSSQSNRHQISPLSRPLLFDLHRRYATVSGEKTSSSANDNNRDSHSSLQTERFHQDMRRVLNSRRKVLEDQHDIDDTTRNNNEKTDHLERRRRPDILESDLDGAERVLIMLKRMVELGLATEETFQIAMRACLQRGRQRWYRQSDRTQVICAADQLEELVDQLRGVVGKVSLETYNLVLEAYAICSTPRGGRNYARRADFLLQRMEEEGLFDSGNGTIGEELNEEIPAETLAHVLHAWAWQQANLQPEDCAERAQEYLFEIQHNSTKPVDTALLLQCYEWVLEAWSKSGSEGSAQNADDIFCRMKELNKTQAESTILSTQSYSNAILAWSKCKDPRSPERAHELLMEMIKHYDEGAFSNSEPELIAFNGVITAWARIGKPKMAEKVLWLADTLRLKCQNLIPNVFTYNSVLQSHVRNPNKKEALERIRNLVDYMEMNAVEQPEIKPNSFTYNCLMKVGHLGVVGSTRKDYC